MTTSTQMIRLPEANAENSNEAQYSLSFGSERQLKAFAARLATKLRSGDILLMSGALGAGKTTFCRAAIQMLIGDQNPVPSPSYTLLQPYFGSSGKIIHADLYRISDPESELAELGLEDAYSEAISFIEWPERLIHIPEGAVWIDLNTEDDKTPEHREILIKLPEGQEMQTRWSDILSEVISEPREKSIERFLLRNGWAEAKRVPLAGDASKRRYERLHHPALGRAILMDCPEDARSDLGAFRRISQHLRNLDLSAPEELADDETQGLLLLEDLGDDLFARILSERTEDEHMLYQKATDLLWALHQAPAARELPLYSGTKMISALRDVFGWYRRALELSDDDQAFAALSVPLSEALHQLAPEADVMLLRDFHAENLIWMPQRSGLACVGLLDFQDAAMGHRAYDLVSLLQDARRDVPKHIEETMIEHYIALSGVDSERFKAAYATLGAQRQIRIMCLFARLPLRDNKPRYLDMMPRVRDYLMRNLAHPKLSDLARAVRDVLPEMDEAKRKKLLAAITATDLEALT